MSRKPRDTEAAEKGLTIRLTTAERGYLDRLVAMETAELAAAFKGRDVAANLEVSAGAYVRSIIREKAREKGLIPAPPVAAPQVEHERPEPVAAPLAVDELQHEHPVAAASVPAPQVDPEVVRAALVAHLAKRTEPQAAFAARLNIDSAQLTRFKNAAGRGGFGLSAPRIAALARALGL